MTPFFVKLLSNKTFISVLITAFICSVISIVCINNINTKWQKIVAQQETRIAELEKKHNESQIQISNLSGQLLVANKQTKIVEEKAIKLQNTVNQLIAKYEGSDSAEVTTVYDSPAEELKVIKVENTQMKEDIKTFIAEIKIDRELIAAQKTELDLHIKKEELMQQDIKTLEDLNEVNKKIVSELTSKLSDETSKKKTWRAATATSGSALLVTILLIVLL